MTRRSLLLLSVLWTVTAIAADKTSVRSPDGRIRVEVRGGDKLYYAVYFDDKPLLLPSQINMLLGNGSTGMPKPSWKKQSITLHRETILPPVAEKRSVIPDVYNELIITFQQPFSLIFRVYDDGVAYRWQTKLKDSIIIKEEVAQFRFPASTRIFFSPVVKRDNADIFHTSFEEPYQVRRLDSIPGNMLSFTPVLLAPSVGPKVVITESDLEDYPGMFLQPVQDSLLVGKFAPFPLEETIADGEFRQAIVTRRADYIAHTKGTRSFPWRVLLIAELDKSLPANDLVYRLGAPSRVKDPSWIKPGKGTDEWIIGVNLFNVPFKSGVNTATYKYYIDFAKRFGFERILMDAGWSDNNDLFRINPDINMEEIAAYAKKQGVSLSMWTLALTLSKQLEPALDQFNRWGVDFIMTDFMDRDDQAMVNFYYRVVEACARHKIMIMYHGAFKPAGISRTYPNAITREAVLGSEYNIWSEKATPEHNLLLPFIRMTAGPMDYEPGLLDNATAKTFRPVAEKVMSPGTRCHQAAMFVVYDSPIQIFSGNPSQGMLEPAYMELIGSLPTTWDTTIILDARLGDYILTARRKGSDWYVAAMTDWSPRELELSFSFLGGEKFDALFCEDGINADRYASDYTLHRSQVSGSDNHTIRLAPGGGFLLRLKKR